jgi:hypothetical protein
MRGFLSSEKMVKFVTLTDVDFSEKVLGTS